MKLKIVFIESNPHQDLKLNREYREIEQAISKSPYRDYIELVSKLAGQANDLIDVLNHEKPDILHFSGHGHDTKGLVFETNRTSNIVVVNEQGNIIDGHVQTEEDYVSSRVLNSLFKTAKKNLKLVFFNACFSKNQAESIVEHVDFVIGMNDAVGDDSALLFSSRFYGSLSAGISIEDSFIQSKALVEIQYLEEENIPELLKRNNRVKDIGFEELVKKEKEEMKENEKSSNTPLTGIGAVTGGTINQTINNNQKTIHAETNIENIEVKDGGTVNF